METNQINKANWDELSEDAIVQIFIPVGSSSCNAQFGTKRSMSQFLESDRDGDIAFLVRNHRGEWLGGTIAPTEEYEEDWTKVSSGDLGWDYMGDEITIEEIGRVIDFDDADLDAMVEGLKEINHSDDYDNLIVVQAYANIERPTHNAVGVWYVFGDDGVRVKKK